MTHAPEPLASVAHAVGRHARAIGFRRLNVFALETSRAAHELATAGFLLRADAQPFVLRTVRKDVALPQAAAWWLSPLEGSAW